MNQNEKNITAKKEDLLHYISYAWQVHRESEGFKTCVLRFDDELQIGVYAICRIHDVTIKSYGSGAGSVTRFVAKEGGPALTAKEVKTRKIGPDIVKKLDGQVKDRMLIRKLALSFVNDHTA